MECNQPQTWKEINGQCFFFPRPKASESQAKCYRAKEGADKVI